MTPGSQKGVQVVVDDVDEARPRCWPRRRRQRDGRAALGARSSLRRPGRQHLVAPAAPAARLSGSSLAPEYGYFACRDSGSGAEDTTGEQVGPCCVDHRLLVRVVDDEGVRRLSAVPSDHLDTVGGAGDETPAPRSTRSRTVERPASETSVARYQAVPDPSRWRVSAAAPLSGPEAMRSTVSAPSGRDDPLGTSSWPRFRRRA